ncbi:Hypp5831 [Branchiostoma lanceolatum]|uniref:Hypp5831 protein n=1 Tax=Branchiostoma lanceolatum TaxID=7740 RepID=A0A8J9VGI9_BRALA|nr:Hypp5831 [Branchiostoma lanceolatum]
MVADAQMTSRAVIVSILLVSMVTSHLAAHVVSCAVPAQTDTQPLYEDVTNPNPLALDAQEPILEALSESHPRQPAGQPAAHRPLLIRLPWPLARALSKRGRKPPNMNSWGQPWGKRDRSLTD